MSYIYIHGAWTTFEAATVFNSAIGYSGPLNFWRVPVVTWCFSRAGASECAPNASILTPKDPANSKGPCIHGRHRLHLWTHLSLEFMTYRFCGVAAHAPRTNQSPQWRWPLCSDSGFLCVGHACWLLVAAIKCKGNI